MTDQTQNTYGGKRHKQHCEIDEKYCPGPVPETGEKDLVFRRNMTAIRYRPIENHSYQYSLKRVAEELGLTPVQLLQQIDRAKVIGLKYSSNLSEKDGQIPKVNRVQHCCQSSEETAL